MQVLHPPRRQAAIRAATNLAESSSDEGRDTDNKTDGHHAPPRVRGGGKSHKVAGKGVTPHERNRSNSGSQDVASTLASTSVKKRKRTAAANLGRKRHRSGGTEHEHDESEFLGGGSGGGSVDDDSDLTPLSSDYGQEEGVDPSTRVLAQFPLQIDLSTSSPKSKKSHQVKQDAYALAVATDVDDDDSDELPDVGTVLFQSSQNDRLSQKLSPSTRNRQPKSRRRKSSHGDIPSSSPTLHSTLPLSPFPLSRRKSTNDDDDTTKPAISNISEHFELSCLSSDSDLELDAVQVGELCLARAKAAGTVYWPAKVLQAKRPLSGKGKQKKTYRVMFLDKKEKDIPRDWFYISSQEEFCTCAIGQFESSHIEVVNDFDEDLRPDGTSDATRRHRIQPPSRSLSPVDLPNPLPLSGPDFCDLPLHQQFSYVTPVLKAIMDEEATWALRRHETYLKGGATRQKLMSEGGLRGAVDAKSADDLLGLVEKWCLGVRGRNFVGDGDEQVRTEENQAAGQQCGVQKPPRLTSVEPPSEAIPEALVAIVNPEPEPEVQGWPPTENPGQHKEVENPPESEPTETEPDSPILSTPITTTVDIKVNDQPPRVKRQRQRGSAGYEQLSSLEKVNYCLEVLLPESLNQLLLWRTAERKSVAVMWNNVGEEKRLHERGEDLLRETDWVMDIMRLRRALATTFGKKRKGGEGDGGTVRSKGKALSRTRSGRVGSMVGSYRE